MTVKKLLLLFTLFIPFLSFSQNTNNSASTPFNCGISAESAALVKERLMANRDLFSRQELEDMANSRTTTYIPVSIHNVAGDASGLGKTDESTILAFLCGLNAIYSDQNVQFYIHNSINNHINNYIYTNAGTSTARTYMISYKVGGTLNLVIGASSTNQVASWYDTQGDFIFLLKTMLTSSAKTEAHEIGHFFTLPHTFYGWEGLDAESTYGGQNVPNTIGSGWSAFSPEKVPRSGGQSNCNQAADGFCDTEADYYSDRTNCPYNPSVKDPNGFSLDPDESNIMSYASDQCVTQFSPQQKSAIAADIASRTWVSSSPNGTADVTGVASVISPLNGNQLGSVSNSTVRLQWSPVTNATMYYLEVYGTYFFGTVNTSVVIFKGIVYNNTGYFNLPTTDLVAGSKYGWRIKALNATSTCAGYTPYSIFEAAASTTTDINDLPIEKQMKFTVNDNPVSGSFIPLEIYSAIDVVGSVRIYSMDGREVIAMTKQNFSQGESIIQVPASELSNGIYVAVLATESGHLQQKIIIQR